jgi:hypothetical protein
MKRRIVLLIAAGLLAAVAVRQFWPANQTPTSAPSVSAATLSAPANAATNTAPGSDHDSVPATQTASKFGIVNPYAAALKVPGKSKRAWDVSFMKTHQHAAAGDAIEFELTGGRMATGIVRIMQYRNGELSYLSGDLSAPEKGEFFFLTPPALGVAGKAVGVVQFPASQTAYRIEPTGPGGEPEFWERRLDEVICIGMPQPLGAATNASANTNGTAEITPLRPDEVPTHVPSYNSNIVSLQSLPGARGVLLLDFAGGYTPTWGGVYYSKPAGINNTTIRDVWKRVAEDFMPFNINVTTDFAVYQAAPETSRQRCAFTDTPVTAAGVAFYGSWNWGGDTPCWSVYSIGKASAEVGAHEPGHTLGLSHQGQWNGVTTTNEYYGGQGSGETGWAPIMGVGYSRPVATWAKGEYNAANQTEDELNIIVSNNNDVDYRADDTGNTLATSRFLEIHPDGSVSAEGVIETTGDTDSFRFTTTGGTVSLTARPVGDWANLGMAVSIASSSEVVLSSNNPQNTLWAGINTSLAAGTYTLRVTGVGKNNPLTDGFSAYGSLGYYSIVGSVSGATLPTRLGVYEHVTNGTVVGTVPANSGGNLVYSITSGNTGGTFAISNSGLLSVANNAALDYAQRATNAMYFVGFELLVNIVNLDNPLLTESNRRVVVSLLSRNANYPLAATGYNAGIMVPYNATTALPKATAFDIPNNYAFYQEGLNGNAQINASGQGLQGFPTDRLVRSQVDGSTFELGPYGGTNALMLGNAFPASGTLALATPQPLNKIAILASSANGGGLGTLVLNFTNGTKSQVFNLNAQDWYGTTANVGMQGFGRVRLGQSTFSTENPGWDNPNIYQTTIDLASLGLNKTVASVTFTNPPVGGSRTTAILGLSGQIMPAAVAITVQPASTTNNVPASSATFSVVAMGAPTLGYQWYRGNPGSGTLLAGKTSTNLVLSSIQLSDAGNYYVVVTNSSSSATSAVAALSVFRAPQIVQQPAPASSARAIGESISYSVAANAALPVSYFWRTNGVILPGATAATLNLANLQSNNAASYSVLVSNTYGSVISTSVSLTIVPPNYPYAQLVLADNPMGYWRLDELSGTTAFDCVGTNSGTYTNTQLGQPGYNLVDTHKSARFGFLASQNSYVGGIPIDFGSTANQSFTLEAWVKGGVPSTDAGLITKGTGAGGEQFNLDCGASGHAYRFFVRKDDGGVVGANSGVTPNNQWQHLVAVLNRSAGYVALYVNGISNASGTFPTETYRGLLRSSNAMTIGSRQSGTTAYDHQFGGYLQDVAVYDYALSPAQILAHYNAASNRAPVFVNNPITKPTANAGQAYASAVNTEATDPNGDTITFAKVSGPAWLTVSASGTLSGTPANANANTNVFIVSARDSGGLSNVATLKIYVNASPTFNADPFSLPDLLVGQSLAANIATNVTDLNPIETLSFAKLSGPAWVQVATSGAVSGTPSGGDAGTNSVTVSVTDSGGLADNAIMTIRVMPPAGPLQASLTPQGSDLLLTWTGGAPPYQVEMNTGLSVSNWIPMGAYSTNTALLITPSNAATFYRVIGGN